jgi:hypothetical protein
VKAAFFQHTCYGRHGRARDAEQMDVLGDLICSRRNLLSPCPGYRSLRILVVKRV